MKKIFAILCFLGLNACSVFPPKPSDELEAITEDVLKRKEGVDIKIEPIKEKK